MSVNVRHVDAVAAAPLEPPRPDEVFKSWPKATWRQGALGDVLAVCDSLREPVEGSGGHDGIGEDGFGAAFAEGVGDDLADVGGGG